MVVSSPVSVLPSKRVAQREADFAQVLREFNPADLVGRDQQGGGLRARRILRRGRGRRGFRRIRGRHFGHAAHGQDDDVFENRAGERFARIAGTREKHVDVGARRNQPGHSARVRDGHGDGAHPDVDDGGQPFDAGGAEFRRGDGLIGGNGKEQRAVDREFGIENGGGPEFPGRVPRWW